MITFKLKSFFFLLSLSLLLFAKESTAQSLDVNGYYVTDFGDLYLYQDGKNVTGEYYYQANGKDIEGKVTDGKLSGVGLTFNWSETSGTMGTASFKFSKDGNTFVGTWTQTNGAKGTGKWNGTKQEGGCFPAGALVTMADGSLKAIESIQKGEMVMVYDIENNRFEAGEVVDNIMHQGDFQLNEASFETLVSENKISDFSNHFLATLNHPIFTNNGVKAMRGLKTGDELRSIYHWVEITQVKNSVLKAEQVYNLKTTKGNYLVNQVVVMDK